MSEDSFRGRDRPSRWRDRYRTRREIRPWPPVTGKTGGVDADHPVPTRPREQRAECGRKSAVPCHELVLSGPPPEPNHRRGGIRPTRCAA